MVEIELTPEEKKQDLLKRCGEKLKEIQKSYNDDFNIDMSSGGRKLYFKNKELVSKSQKNEPGVAHKLLPTSGRDLYLAIEKVLKKENNTTADYKKILLEIYTTLKPKTEEKTGIRGFFGIKVRSSAMVRFNNARIDAIKPLLKDILNQDRADTNKINSDDELDAAIQKENSLVTRISKVFKR